MGSSRSSSATARWVAVGRFLFRYRNGLFPVIYLLIFVPSPPVLSVDTLALLLGVSVALLGQIVRALSIGLVYIVRGGRNGQAYAEDLVTEGLFAHSRNPLYLGNILILLGVGLALNSLLFVALGGGFFVLAYAAIISAEEDYLHGRFGEAFERYRRRVPRIVPSLSGIGQTLREHRFRWQRLLVKEYGATFAWMAGLVLGKLVQLSRSAEASDESVRLLWILFGGLCLAYAGARLLKKTEIVRAD